jgi:hypothetical protein
MKMMNSIFKRESGNIIVNIDPWFLTVLFTLSFGFIFTALISTFRTETGVVDLVSPSPANVGFPNNTTHTQPAPTSRQTWNQPYPADGNAIPTTSGPLNRSSGTAGYNPSAVLIRPGDASSIVAYIQIRLESLEYYSGSINEEFDATTQAAFDDFRLKQGSLTSGEGVRYDDFCMLMGDFCTRAQVEIPSASIGDEGDRISLVQFYLKEQGYYEGDITGIFDIATENAIFQFKLDNDFPETRLLTQDVFCKITSVCSVS